jgi:hypothetical protein
MGERKTRHETNGKMQIRSLKKTNQRRKKKPGKSERRTIGIISPDEERKSSAK